MRCKFLRYKNRKKSFAHHSIIWWNKILLEPWLILNSWLFSKGTYWIWIIHWIEKTPLNGNFLVIFHDLSMNSLSKMSYGKLRIQFWELVLSNEKKNDWIFDCLDSLDMYIQTKKYAFYSTNVPFSMCYEQEVNWIWFCSTCSRSFFISLSKKTNEQFEFKV